MRAFQLFVFYIALFDTFKRVWVSRPPFGGQAANAKEQRTQKKTIMHISAPQHRSGRCEKISLFVTISISTQVYKMIKLL